MRQGTTRRRLMLGGCALGGATLTAALAACATQQSPAQPAAPSRPQGKIYHMSRADPYILDLFKEQAKVFMAEHPGVQVEIDHQEQAAWLEKFKTMVASGSPLDSAFANDSNDVLFARDGLVADLDPFLARQKDFKEADFADGSWFAMRFQGKRYGLPWDSGAYGLFFNLDLFDAAGVPYLDPKKRLTWDELLGIARRLTLDGNGRHPNKGGFDPAGVRQYGFATSLTFGLANFVFANGGEMLTGEGKVGLEQPQAIEAIQFLADLRSRHYVWNAPQFTPPQPIGFRTNNLAIDHNGAWNLGRYAQDVKRVGIAPAPFKRTAASGGHYSPLVLTRHSQNRDAAWAWMYFACLSETGQGMLSDAGQMQPNRLSLAQRFVNAPGGKVDGKYRQVLIDEMTGGALRVPGDKVGTYWGGYPGWGPVLTPLLTPVWRGEVSAAQAMPEIRRLTEQYLQTGQPPVINQP